MAKPNVFFLYNSTEIDGKNTGNAGGGTGEFESEWVVIDTILDSLLFLDSQQLDGDPNDQEKYPVIIPYTGTIEAPKTFISDASEGTFEQVRLAGTIAGDQLGGANIHVFCIHFDGATAGIPYLEAWDSYEHTSCVDPFLGNGTAANSTLYALMTTNYEVGWGVEDWIGTPLAGSDSAMALDEAMLTSSKNLYFNIKQVISAGFSPRTVSTLVLTLRFLYA